jgi:asparagine synthase (glutamine-hydrolysing)
VFRGITELPPGHVLLWQPDTGIVRQKYWTLRFDPDYSRSDATWIGELDEALLDAVRSHLVSDVPVGAFLSGGLDSGAVLAYMAAAGVAAPRAYTVRFAGASAPGEDETSLARLAAQRFGAEHTVLDVTPRAIDIMDEVIGALDQPLADTSTIPTYYLTRAVAREVKVALSGLGGDELFGGYERHAGIVASDRLEIVPPGLRRLLGTGGAAALRQLGPRTLATDRIDRFLRHADQGPDGRYLGFVTRMGSADLAALLHPDVFTAAAAAEARERLLRCFGADGGAPILNRALAHDFDQYLPGDILPLTDRLSMWHSLEVRVPFLDHRLVELAARIPPALKVRGRQKKFILRRLLASRLPPPYFTAPKRGFTAPVTTWLRGELREYVADALGSAAVRQGGWFRAGAAERLAQRHRDTGADRDGMALWSALVFLRWHEHWAAPVAVGV